MELAKHGSGCLGETVVHADACIGEQFHEHEFILDGQSRTANLNIPQLVSELAYAPAAQALDVLPDRRDHTKSSHMLLGNNIEEDLEIGKVADKNQSSANGQHTT